MKAPERAKNHILYGWDGWGETRPPLIYRLKRISPTRYEDDIVDVDNDKWSASASEAEPERKQLDERLIKLKSTPIIMQDFSIVGIKKQWEWQQSEYIVKRGSGPLEGMEFYFKKIDLLRLPEQNGCKTETRRTRGLDEVNADPDMYKVWHTGNGFPNKGHFNVQFCLKDYSGGLNEKFDGIIIKCPYGKVGDELWVKETWCVDLDVEGGFLYKEKNPGALDPDEDISPWKSPLFMPKAASRIRLEITSIKVERLQDITEEGAYREGIYKVVPVPGDGDTHWVLGDPKGVGAVYWAPNSAVHLFNRVFIDLHGEELLAKNPWVWVIQFTVKEFKQ